MPVTQAFEGCTSLLYLIVPDSVTVDPKAMSAPCQVIRRSEVPDDIAMLSELQRLQNGILSENSFVRKCPFAFLLSDSMRPFEAEALVAMLRAGLLKDKNLNTRYWKLISLIEFPTEQTSKLAVLKKNWKNITSKQEDLPALSKYLDELLD